MKAGGAVVFGQHFAGVPVLDDEALQSLHRHGKRVGPVLPVRRRRGAASGRVRAKAGRSVPPILARVRIGAESHERANDQPA